MNINLEIEDKLWKIIDGNKGVILAYTYILIV
ncbi:hypothetical protein BACCIP111895_00980 [Neobacillus rhizosphaerae]|uniref:Uncharacterized protein n=1 Tax=Neobacillus rhizosphaerae TaxID=2880965 RepID=A0ABN8KNK1_9BACI|nr:hypothetical protein BACCIP111895_00980 [Neobacillus rhizosphaerae]